MTNPTILTIGPGRDDHIVSVNTDGTIGLIARRGRQETILEFVDLAAQLAFTSEVAEAARWRYDQIAAAAVAR